MKILVTGGAGFIASQIADSYVALGHDVTIVDDLSSGKKKNVNPKATFVAMDIRDPNISTLFAKSGFDIVNHLAAQIDVRRSVQDPFLDASVNILGTLRLLDCCRTYGVRKFIFSSSGGTIYGECKTRPGKEDDAPRPSSPYGFSKATAETYIRFFGEFYHLPYTILRYGNVYGPRQDPNGEAGVVSIFIGKLLAGEPVTIYGTGEQERDYVQVGDIVEANNAALLKGENDVFNIGTGVPVSVNRLYQELCAIHQGGSKPDYAPARPGELERSVLDIGKAAKGLGWKPARTLAQGLTETYRYFQSQKKPPSKRT
ncbi:MAG: NAD-dependent epimerase/dehydratase family protein [Elusimicrobiota bacterium]|jgi:UDP-glucose 4-epimerase